ncbi:hypothetical protein D9619_004655 [Psilocybe cf. subviscida]|uniref:DUF6593 domain-containing protein n=1 Tax=Psilocybe cf. subviscida TaxID=2480587 RepID=A0A8H5BQP5_9AGAR|nr:hypothetical protein D9619_004655 [Psilocybe cf. subviscida]
MYKYKGSDHIFPKRVTLRITCCTLVLNMSLPQYQLEDSKPQYSPNVGRQDEELPGYSRDNHLYFSANNIPYVKLCFTKKTLVNTAITLKGVPYFKVSTVDAPGAVTNIKDARTGVLISTINRRILRPDTVTFPRRYNGQPQKIKEWLSKSGAYPAETWTLEAGLHTLRLSWDASTHNRLLLYKDGDGEHAGWCDPATETESFTLYIRDSMEDGWGMIITAVICILHKRLLEDSASAVNDAASTLRLGMSGRGWAPTATPC